MLEGIHNALLRTEEEKRRMELESRLYRKWRQGEDRVLLESKSNHEALAKMNWLDKQVDFILLLNWNARAVNSSNLLFLD